MGEQENAEMRKSVNYCEANATQFSCQPVKIPGTLMVRDLTVNQAYAWERYPGSNPGLEATVSLKIIIVPL